VNTPLAPPGDDPVAAGWAWLSRLPRAATAHAERGDDPLAAVRTLLAALDHPEQRLQVIHVAGSKGKGSTALYTEALLEALGYRTFTFTSPHLERWSERLRLHGAEALPARSLAALEAVRAATERTGVVPGFFEALTVAGLRLAADAGVDWGVIECGIGGRADATNVVVPAITIITSIEYEHADRLGGTLTAIAEEKAGIVKPGAPLIAPQLPQATDAVLARAAHAAEVPHQRLRPASEAPPDATTTIWDCTGRWLTVTGPHLRVSTPIAAPGHAMAANAALALSAVARLGVAEPGRLEAAAGVLATTAPAGRMETVSCRPWIIIDSAHTAASAAALAQSLEALQAPRLHLLLSCSASKDIEAVLAPLAPRADAATTTCADATWSLAAADLAAHVRAHRPDLAIESIPDPADARDHIGATEATDTLVLATGSVYLAGAVRKAVRGH
jgi:dihydrofolate synthase/folylpolyglutamate synthase